MDLDSHEKSDHRSQVETACGSLVEVTEQMSWVNFREEVVYFCQPDCKALYKQDPRNSCLAARILIGK